jgi:hypothetical protein
MTAPRSILRAIRREGGVTAIMTGATEPFMIPYALAHGAGAFEAGLLSSGRNLLVAILQLWSAELAGCLRASRPEMAVFYLGEEKQISDSVAREVMLGQAQLLPKPLAPYRLLEAVARLEEARLVEA